MKNLVQHTKIRNAIDEELEETLRERKALKEQRERKKQFEAKSPAQEKSSGSRGEGRNDDPRGTNDEPVPDPTPLPPPREPMAPPTKRFTAKKSPGAARATFGLPIQPFQPFQLQALPHQMPRAPPLTPAKDGHRATHSI